MPKMKTTKTKKTKPYIKIRKRTRRLNKRVTKKTFGGVKGARKLIVLQNIPPFISSEGEDDLEASLSFLIDLLGSSLYDTYVDDVLNMKANQNIELLNVPRPIKPPANTMMPGYPKIFYGNGKGTHFTCTLDGVKLWNSYTEGIQMRDTDHFCQTFVLMRMQNEFLPTSFIGEEYTKLHKYQYLDNVMVAIKVGCYIIELLQNEFDIDSQINETLEDRDVMTGNIRHLKNPALLSISNQELIQRLIRYCRSLTNEQVCASTFKQKIFLL